MATATEAATEVALQERVDMSADRVDRTLGVIKRVRILGPVSRNGRRYTPECLRAAVPLYEGAKVNVDHPKPGEGASRPPRVRFGELRGVHLFEGAMVGDLHYLRSHEMAGPVAEAAERMPSLFGLSHDANAKLRLDRDGVTIVEQITKVRSVDLVSDPATNDSLFESQGSPSPVPPPAPVPAQPVDTRTIDMDHVKAVILEANNAGIHDGILIETLLDLPAEKRASRLAAYGKLAGRNPAPPAGAPQPMSLADTVAFLRGHGDMPTSPVSVKESAPAKPLPIDPNDPLALKDFLRGRA